jgi:hypothetical protein
MPADGSNEVSDKTQTGKPANQKLKRHPPKLKALRKPAAKLWRENAQNVEWI